MTAARRLLIWRLALLVLAALTAWILLRNAWVVDDAYITFRTVDNFLGGHGLTWNVGERVQVYTHPLWMFVMAGAAALTGGEVFFTSIVLSLLLALGAWAVLAWSLSPGLRERVWQPALLLLVMVAGKAIVDYAGSGLENALAYFIAALFLARLLVFEDTGDVHSDRRLGLLFLLACLAFLNRMDNLLLFLPVLLWLLWSGRAHWSRRRLGLLALAVAPAVLWELFSLWYYGYPFPNTAYAKLLSVEFPWTWKVHRGWDYLVNSLNWDPASWLVLLGAGVVTRLAPSRRLGWVLVGVVLYVIYVVLSAASATHMSGRFFALPLFVAGFVFVRGIRWTRLALLTTICLLLVLVISPVSNVKFGTRFYRVRSGHHSAIDTKQGMLASGAAFLDWKRGVAMPDHLWYRYGLAFRDMPQKVHLGGAFHGEPIGYMAYASGPGKYVIDVVGLGDPLLSRLPARVPERFDDWKSGHFHRDVPQGYIETLMHGGNRLEDGNLARYYEAVLEITRGDLGSWSRLGVIWNMNTGKYGELVRDFEARRKILEARSRLK